MDSMAVYRGMDIGTATPTTDERAGVPHHLLDVVDPWCDHTVADHQAMVNDVLESIAARHVDATTMPRLLELGTDHAVWFDDHVAEAPVSIKALFSLLCGLPPLPSRELESAVLPRLDCRSLPEQLAGRGFDAGFFHGGYFAFTDKLALLTERGFSALVDGENLIEVFARDGAVPKSISLRPRG